MIEEKINLLIATIKKKKELAGISDSFIRKELLNYFKKNAGIESKIKSTRSLLFKQIVKAVRKELRRTHGLFGKGDVKRRQNLVEELVKRKNESKQLVIEVLKTHASTRERLDTYKKLYQQIFVITGKPKTILDLGCGINPFSIVFINLKKLKYYGYDINTEEINLVNLYFSNFKKIFSGTARVLDFTETKKIKDLPPADICFMFKITDVLDKGKGHKKTELVMKNIPASYIVVSFPTVTMSGKKMRFPKRKWFELMCTRLGWRYNCLEFPNELFYVVRK